MSTKFYVKIGDKPYGYAQEEERSFETSVFPSVNGAIEVRFWFDGSRHHVGAVETTPEVARWLAHALLAAIEAAPDARINSIKVQDDVITQRSTSMDSMA